MRTSAFVVVVAFAALAGAAPVPPPNTREAAQLVEKLGSADFAEREAATKRLDELGVLALDDLRAACKSENPEAADRAKDLVRKIERRVSSERALAPTVVELDAKDRPLDAVLAALSKQAGCEVVLGGLKTDELAAKKITVATGKVPFWAAVLKVCAVADLQVACVSGFVAPGSIPYYGKSNKTDGATARGAADPTLAVVLEARDGTRKWKRPASVHGAVLVEAFETPQGGAAPGANAVLQFWPEPKLAWQSVASLKVTTATDDDGRKLIPDMTLPPAPSPPRIGRAPGSAPPGAMTFAPNIRQAVVTFKPVAEPVPLVRELTGSAYGLVRSAVEPLATVTLDPQKAVAATGQAGVELTASVRTDAKGKKLVDVTLSFPPTPVEPARPGDELPDTKPSAAGGNRSWLGVRVTDAAGAAFQLALIEQTSDFIPAGRRILVKMTLEPIVAKDGPTVPAKVVFWGTTVKQVEVPFAFKDVPLVGGPK
jgi:hypothetical protein